MNLLKLVFRYLFKILGLLLLTAIIYFLFAVLLSSFPVNKNFKNAENGITVYIRSNGVHTDFILPVETKIINWSEKIPYAHFQLVDSSFKWLAFGWGNREFYIETKEWSDLKVSTALRAGIGVGECVMHVEYKRRPLKSHHWARMVIDEKKYLNLKNYIYTWFKTDSSGNFIHIENSGYYSNDTFYEAHGTYTIFHTCNEWTGGGLRVTGIRTGAWTPFEISVMHHLRLIR